MCAYEIVHAFFTNIHQWNLISTVTHSISIQFRKETGSIRCCFVAVDLNAFPGWTHGVVAHRQAGMWVWQGSRYEGGRRVYM